MEYVCLYVIVDRHLGQKAIHIAQANGAGGATLIHGRGFAENIKSPIFFNMTIEPEKDIVLMLIKKELEETIKGKIYKEMELEKEGRGIIYSLPVNEVSGLVEQNS
ncbi:transcriptional regulator [Anaerococcus tetradius]|uniref:transcriptional regulator n=1 Tax=Anaerococcus tetradius TaxID=33036 RepID=UPI0023F07B50|nr:transcriptional regulator [Anaerococcus tetradius]